MKSFFTSFFRFSLVPSNIKVNLTEMDLLVPVEVKDEDEEVLLALAASMENMKDPIKVTSKDEVDATEKTVEKEESNQTVANKPRYLPLPEEPKGDRSLLSRVGIRLPDGRRLQRNFLRTDPIQVIRVFQSLFSLSQKIMTSNYVPLSVIDE